ncbi:unnamed protein product [Durusdinium trenchii]|uniref:Syndetin C-terminal domain-containing protein n=1 Tax=Durusdinium trenchii TaxID=1381693 RepID=A0ABP0RNJ2_9DINO
MWPDDRAPSYVKGSSLPLPDSCASYLQVQAPVMGSALLQVTPFSSLASPSLLCGLAERCVGVESVRSLLASLQERRDDLVALLPKDVAQEAVDRFFQAEEVVALQLRSFVLMNAARDVWEVPDVGRISLDHFSNTVQALRWDATSFPSSPAAPYLQNLKGQIDELARRVPCAGGGSIPFSTQCIFWGWVEVRLMQECLEVLAKCGRRKTPEALMCLAEDFRSIHQAAEQHFRSEEQVLFRRCDLVTSWLFVMNVFIPESSCFEARDLEAELRAAGSELAGGRSLLWLKDSEMKQFRNSEEWLAAHELN